MITLGMILEWATLPMLIMWSFIVALYYRLDVKEEKDMMKEFGKEYVQYMKRTK